MSLLLKAIERVTPEYVHRLMAAVLAVENMDAQEGDAAQAKFESLIFAAKNAGFTRPVDVAGFAMANAVVEAQTSRWIRVSERLPKYDHNNWQYLVYDNLNNKVNHDYWVCPEDGGKPFWNHNGLHVTHWQPLPDAPDEVQP